MVPGLLSARSCPAAAPPGAGSGAGSPAGVPVLDPAAGLPVVLVVGVALAAVPFLVVLFFARGRAPRPGSLRRSWPCCRSSSVCFCRLPPVRIAAGLPVVMVAGAVLLVVGKEQGGRVILGPGGSTWCRACCPPGGARQLLRLVPGLVPDRRRRCRCPPGAGRVILRQVPGLDPAAGLLVVLVVGVAAVALVALFFARGPVPWPGSPRCSWPCCRPSSAWSCWLPPVRIAAGFPVVVAPWSCRRPGDPRPGCFRLVRAG